MTKTNGLNSAEAVEQRQRYVEAWNKTMITIWQEQITLLDVIDTKQLLQSPIALPVRADGRFFDINLTQQFLEYGLWQDYGTGREFRPKNGGNLEFLDSSYRKKHRLNKPRKVGPKWGGGMTSGQPRERRRWFSKKYYSSVLNFRDFMADSTGQEFLGIITRQFNDGLFKSMTEYYKRNKRTL